MIKQCTVENKQVDIKYFFAAPVEKVFAAWVDPDKMVKWMGPHEVVCNNVEIDLRVGGEFMIDMKAPGGQHIAFGEYKEIIENKKLVFSFQWKDGTFTNSIVELTFDPHEDGTLLRLQHTLLPDENAAKSHSEGWTGSLEKLEKIAG